MSLIVFVRVRTAAKLAGKTMFCCQAIGKPDKPGAGRAPEGITWCSKLASHEQTTRIVNLFFLGQSPADTASIGSLGGSRHHRTNCSHLLQRRCLKLSNAQSSVCTT